MSLNMADGWENITYGKRLLDGFAIINLTSEFPHVNFEICSFEQET